MKRYLVKDPADGQYVVDAASPEDLVKKLHRASHAPTADDATWMHQVSDRTMTQSGDKLRYDTAENFVADLMKFGFVEIVT